jgi:hypothetical protein
MVEGILLTVQTNDSQIVMEMPPSCAREIKSHIRRPVLVRVFRDDEAPTTGSEIVTLIAGPLVTLLVGTGTMLVLDCERREILGFLSPSVSAERFARELLPVLLNRLRSETQREPCEVTTTTL